jgi:hypothetical protein|tara:strand:- start:393 stop:917 length:525 start_codon:yes stop_codon:yes gene_type:complete
MSLEKSVSKSESRKREVPDDIYIGFFEEGSRLSRSYTKDAGEKRGLLSRTFPVSCSDVDHMTGFQVGVKFNNFMDTARGVAYENISSKKLEYIATIALMPFPHSQEKRNISVKEIKTRLRELKKLGYPVIKGVGEMKKVEAEDYLKSVQDVLTLRLKEENPEVLNEIYTKNQGL